MDGTLGSRDRLHARRLRRADHERRGARGDRAPRRRGRVPGRRARDRRPREPRGARRVRGDAGRCGSRSGSGTASSTRSCSRRRISAASPSSASPARCSSPTRRRIAISPTALGRQDRGAYAYRSLLDSGAVVANGSDAPIEELDPLAGIRAGVRRTIDDRPAVAPRAVADRRARRFRRRASRPPGSPATSAAAARCSRATRPTSSSSTATRGTTSTRRSSRRWSPAAGSTTRRPGPDRAADRNSRTWFGFAEPGSRS